MILTAKTVWDLITPNRVSLELLQCFLVVIMGSVCFILFMSSNKYFRGATVKYFFYAILCVIFLSISDALEAYFRTWADPNFFRKVCACLSYSLRPLILYFVIRQFTTKNKTDKYAWLIIPALINICLMVLAFYTDANDEFFVIDYTLNNEIIRGPLVSAPFIASTFYFVIVLIIGIKNQRLGYTKEVFLILFTFVFICVTTLLEMKYQFKGVLPGCCMLGVIFYYMYYLSYTYSLDYLTGTFVRFKLFDDAVKLRTNFTIIEFDVNGLKAINDAEGHAGGDKALTVVVDTIKSISPFNTKMYRMGGDEFVILYKTTSIDKVLNYINAIKNALTDTPYSISIGFSIKDDSETFEEGLINSDKMMYQEKEFYHQENKGNN